MVFSLSSLCHNSEWRTPFQAIKINFLPSEIIISHYITYVMYIANILLTYYCMIISLFIVKMNSSQINQMRFSMGHVADIPPHVSSPNYRIYVNTQEEPPLALQLPRHSLHTS